MIEREILKSEAYRSLSGTAKTVYTDFLLRRRVKRLEAKKGRKKETVILNNGELEYTYAEAEKKHPPILRSAFMRALDCLIGRGLLDVVHSGSGGRRGDKSLYAISERWKTWGTPEFIPASRPKDTRDGRGFETYWKKRRANMGNENDNPTVIENDNPR